MNISSSHFLNGVDRGDIGMIQRRCGFGFDLKPLPFFGIRGNTVWREFDGHLAFQPGSVKTRSRNWTEQVIEKSSPNSLRFPRRNRQISHFRTDSCYLSQCGSQEMSQ